MGQGGGARRAEWQEAQRRATREPLIISLEELTQRNPVRDSGNRSVEMFYGYICVFFLVSYYQEDSQIYNNKWAG